MNKQTNKHINIHFLIKTGEQISEYTFSHKQTGEQTSEQPFSHKQTDEQTSE